MRLPDSRPVSIISECAGGLAFFALLALMLFGIGLSDGFDEALCRACEGVADLRRFAGKQP